MAAGRKTGGRRPGFLNRRTAERDRAMAQAAARIEGALGIAAFRGDAHALLVAVYKDETQPIELRVDAAKAAVRYEKPALASTEVKIGNPIERLSDEQLDRLIALMEAQPDAPQTALREEDPLPH